MKYKRRRTPAFIRQQKTFASPCPNCGTRLDGFTAASVGAEFPRDLDLTGRKTMCCYCGAFLVFADKRGTLRAMTLDERVNWRPHPDQWRVYRNYRIDHGLGDPGDSPALGLGGKSL